MRDFVTPVFAVVVVAFLTSMFPQQALVAGAPKAPPKDRVVVMYFHRTHRCPTCLKMGGYSEEAVKTGFAKQLKEGTVEFYYIDFQAKKYAAYTKAYKITGPTLIVAKVKDNKVAEFKNLKDIWSNVNNKKAFVKYVQDHITAYRAKDAAK